MCVCVRWRLLGRRRRLCICTQIHAEHKIQQRVVCECVPCVMSACVCGARKTRAAAVSTSREARKEGIHSTSQDSFAAIFSCNTAFPIPFQSRMLLDKLLSHIAGTRNQVSQNEGGNI